mmetsp:Transcript_116413/g.370348  ORF Transcript_116413/g.370348 Transcript_116413/m.370348 type:complete len:215 (-) Transcript_116413:982-1626(-)
MQRQLATAVAGPSFSTAASVWSDADFAIRSHGTWSSNISFSAVPCAWIRADFVVRNEATRSFSTATLLRDSPRFTRSSPHSTRPASAAHTSSDAQGHGAHSLRSSPIGPHPSPWWRAKGAVARPHSLPTSLRRSTGYGQGRRIVPEMTSVSGPGLPRQGLHRRVLHRRGLPRRRQCRQGRGYPRHPLHGSRRYQPCLSSFRDCLPSLWRDSAPF